MKKKNAKKGGSSKKDKKERDETAPAAHDEAEAETPAEDAAAGDEPDEKKIPIPAIKDLKIEDKAATGGDEGIPDVTSPSVQSKMRSASFKAGGPLSPGFPFTTADASAADIYRKQVARIEDLEKENKRLAKEAADAEKRWQKAEGQLDDLRESGGDEGEIEKLVRILFNTCIFSTCCVEEATLHRLILTQCAVASRNRLTPTPE